MNAPATEKIVKGLDQLGVSITKYIIFQFHSLIALPLILLWLGIVFICIFILTPVVLMMTIIEHYSRK